MVKNLIVLIILFFANFCIAQSGAEKHFKKFIFSYNYGASLPKGDFAKTGQSKLPMSRFNQQDTAVLNGYAKQGFHYDIYVIYKFKPYIGIMAAVSGDQNNYDIDRLNSQYQSLYPNTLTTIVTGDNYYIVQYLVGPYIDITVIKNLGVELKVLYGFTTANYPGLNYIGVSETKLYTSQTGSAGGYSIGAGINYTAVDLGVIGLGLHLDVNYAGSTISYPNYSITNYTASSAFINSSTYNFPKTMELNILQITMGVSLEF